jgi:ribA/ribD-fused uncharacterized protein
MPIELTDDLIGPFRGDWAFLSNFAQGYPFIWNRIMWPTSEHAFQWAKTDDPTFQDAIRRAPTPRDAKRIGRQAPLRPDWDETKTEIMKGILLAKFVNEPLRSRLLATDPHPLAEVNDWGDMVWGVNRAGQGENRLGAALMWVRDQLRPEPRTFAVGVGGSVGSSSGGVEARLNAPEDYE